MRWIISPLIVTLLLTGCTSPGGGDWQDLGCVTGQERGRGTQEGTWMATDPSGFQPLWSESCSNEEIPDVDFGEEQVVAYFWGEKSTGGYILEVQEVKDGSPHQILIERITPGEDCATTAALTYPGIVLAIDLQGPIEVVTTDAVRDCPA